MMNNSNDLNRLKDSRYDQMRQPEKRSFTGWIIGGLVALAVVIGVVLILPHRTDDTAVNGRPTTTDATTVGAGSGLPNTPALGQRPATDH